MLIARFLMEYCKMIFLRLLLTVLLLISRSSSREWEKSLSNHKLAPHFLCFTATKCFEG